LSAKKFDKVRSFRRRDAGVLSYGVRPLHLSLFGILCRSRGDRRCDDRRRVASVASHGVPRHISAIFGILCRRQDVRRCDVLRLFSSVMYGVPRLHLASFGILCRIRDARRRPKSQIALVPAKSTDCSCPGQRHRLLLSQPKAQILI
jgi:hypothetical protein